MQATHNYTGGGGGQEGKQMWQSPKTAISGT